MQARTWVGSAVASVVVVAGLGLGSPAAQAAGEGQSASTAGCTASGRYGGGFRTSLGSGWTSLARRTGPCTSSTSKGSFSEGSLWAVRKEVHGQFICRGQVTYGYGTDVWFQDSSGYWAWSGGTADARWNYKKGC